MATKVTADILTTDEVWVESYTGVDPYGYASSLGPGFKVGAYSEEGYEAPTQNVPSHLLDDVLKENKSPSRAVKALRAHFKPAPGKTRT